MEVDRDLINITVCFGECGSRQGPHKHDCMFWECGSRQGPHERDCKFWKYGRDRDLIIMAVQRMFGECGSRQGLHDCDCMFGECGRGQQVYFSFKHVRLAAKED